VEESAAARKPMAKTGVKTVFKRESGDGSNRAVLQFKKNLKTCNSEMQIFLII
jgi:hypothetical protein